MTEVEQALRREVARASRYGETFSLLAIDAAPAPEVLDRVRDGVRLCDVVLAAGGDRIAVVLPETPLQGALQVALRLAATWGRGGAAPEEPGPAVGVAVYPSPKVADARALLAAAEAALGRARAHRGVST